MTKLLYPTNLTYRYFIPEHMPNGLLCPDYIKEIIGCYLHEITSHAYQLEKIQNGHILTLNPKTYPEVVTNFGATGIRQLEI